MIELKDNINFHNLYLDYKPKSWFKRVEGETVQGWLERVAYQPASIDSWIDKMRFRDSNEYWLEDSFKITFSVLSFLRENKITKEDLEEQLNFELDLSGKHNWLLSEIRKIEEVTKLELWGIKR